MVNCENDGFCYNNEQVMNVQSDKVLLQSVQRYYQLPSCSQVRLNKLVLHCIVRKKHINMAVKLHGKLGSRVCLVNLVNR